MATQLTDVKIKCISILTDDKQPANGHAVIVKDDGNTVEIEAIIHKFDPEGFLIIRPMISKEIDSDDEFYEEVDVREASYAAIKNIQKGSGNLFDTNHDFNVLEDVYFVETKVFKEDGKDIWEMKVDIRENEGLMEKAKAGLINGVSIAGSAKKLKVKKFEQLVEKFKNKSIFKDIKVEEVIKDFDTTLENRNNTDLYFPMDIFWTAVWDAWYKNDDIDMFKKEFKKICTQAVKYVSAMTFEYIEKEVIPNKNEGENMEKQVQTEVQAMIDKALEPVVKSLGLGEGQTIADVIQKAIGEIKPPESPVVKDKDGKEVTLVEVITGLVTKVDAQTEELIVLKKAATDNAENPLTDDEKAEALAKTKRLKDANKADSSLT